MKKKIYFGMVVVLFLLVSNHIYSAIPAQERAALIAFYYSTNGDNWTDSSGWKTPPLDTDGFALPGTESGWYGITVEADQVIRIEIYNNNLNGSIPSDLGNLSNLRGLSLDGNQLSGNIPPELGNLSNLQGLCLSNNQLSGNIPPELGNLSNLLGLYLSNNQLSGNIPPELGNLSNLQELYLFENQLSGSIPSQLGNLSNLQTLWMSINQLTGSIPPELGNLSYLQALKLESNQLSGSIPPELGNLTNLHYLDLLKNQLSGNIPSQLGNLTNLQALSLGVNQLSGSIPYQLGNLCSLHELYLYHNQLSGNIPPELGNLSNLQYLELFGNQLSGEIPSQLGNLGNLQYLWLHSNQLSGSIPLELGNLSNLLSLYLFDNQLKGGIPAELGNLSNLQYLWLNSNQLSGSIPLELCNLSNLQTLRLSINQLSGSILPELGNLSKLRELYLYGNQLSGSIPLELCNLSNMQYLFLDLNQLSGSIPVELGNLSNLKGLGLSNNPLSGSIPLELGNLSNLQELYLSHNQLSGDIPTELGNLSNLQRLELFYNQLSGSIPAELGNLSKLTHLKLHQNQLTGGIPSQLGNLSNLQELYLSYNQLSGEIPTTLTNLTAITSFNIRYNCLYATYPTLRTWLNNHESDWENTQNNCGTITVTSPNGGEAWQAGSMHNITWTNTGSEGSVKIQYSADNGENWTEIISSTENTGIYNWTVPFLTSNNCLVRIERVGGLPADVSDAVFTIFSNPAGWIPGQGMQNNMIVYGTAYNGVTNASTGDWIGAFGPGGVSDCRAVAAIGPNGSYYLTVGSNASSAEIITFKLFPLPSGPSMDSSESIEFISDNVYPRLPLHFGTGTQSIQLISGWNWISFHILPGDTTLNSVFAPIQAYVEQVKSQSQAAIYSSGNWIGDLADMSGIANGIMYKVKTVQPCTLIVNGVTISFNKPLPLITNWNWTAYLPTSSLPVGTAISSIFSQLNQVKSQTQSVIKIGDGLTGDLTQMAPNKGYTIKMTAPGVLVYPYCVPVSFDRPGETSADAAPNAQTVPWKTIQGNQYNMVSYGKVFFEGQAVTAPGYYLVGVGPKSEGDCRSISPVGTDGNYFSTVLGNTNGEAIKFKLYNSAAHKTYDVVETWVFQSDTLKADSNFRARSVRITAPGEGEKLNMGSICTIAWGAYEVRKVKIELYKNSKSLSVIAASVPANSHSFSWTIPTRMRSGNNYQIKISAADAGVMAEDITANFTILPTAALVLNYPVGTEVWQVKRSYDITWGSSGISNIKIELYKGAALNTVIAASTPAAAGKYTWTVPANQTLGSDYKIKISSVDVGVNLSDISKSAFTIAAYKNTAADFDGDGKADLVWRYYGTGGYNCIWLSGVGQGSDPVDDARLAPQAVTIQNETNIDNKIVGTGDFNNDGKEDLLWRDKVTGANSVWYMNGTTFAGTVPLQAETTISWGICGTGDFDSDGKVDILWRNRTSGSNKVWLMNGTTRTGEVSLSTEANLNWDIVGAGDFNGDGKPDILWRNTTDGTNRIWIMNGTTLVRTEQLSTVNADWEIVGVGDYDGNGKSDIFWRHKVDGRDSVWIMDGLARAESLNLTRVTNYDWKIEN